MTAARRPDPGGPQGSEGQLRRTTVAEPLAKGIAGGPARLAWRESTVESPGGGSGGEAVAEPRWRKTLQVGEIFPLGDQFSEPRAGQHLSRGVRQRIQKRRAVAEVVDEARWGLDWLSGFSEVQPPGSPSPAAQSSVERIKEAAAGRQPPADRLGAHEASRALLGARAGYTATGEVKLAPYQAGPVSLVDDAAEGPLVHSVADSRSRRYLDEWEQRMLRSESDYELVMQSEAPIEVDSVLKGSGKQYSRV